MKPSPARPAGWLGGKSSSDVSALTTYELRDDGVALLRLDRPEARNAMSTALLAELLGRVATAAADEAVRVLVFSTTSTVALSAGADVREQLDRAGHVARMELFSEFYDAVVTFPRPTVAVCVGNVVGGGAELAVGCDLRVGGANLGLRFPGGALGMPVGPARLVTLCGLAAAKYLLFTSRTVGAEEALRLGLVSETAPAEEAEEKALALAAEVAAHPPEAIARLKSMLHEWDGLEARSRTEGEAQVAHLREGADFPGVGSPYGAGPKDG